MLRLSKKGDYGIEVLATLSKLKAGELMTITKISETKKLPSYFLSQVMSDLKKAGLVKSKEGIGGGYCLTKRPSDISLLEIIEIFEGKASLVKCMCDEEEKCNREKFCSCQKGWSKLGTEMAKFFKDKTLQDLINLSNES